LLYFQAFLSISSCKTRIGSLGLFFVKVFKLQLPHALLEHEEQEVAMAFFFAKKPRLWSNLYRVKITAMITIKYVIVSCSIIKKLNVQSG